VEFPLGGGGFAVEPDYDAVSQVQAMDMQGLDVSVLFRTLSRTFPALWTNFSRLKK